MHTPRTVMRLPVPTALAFLILAAQASAHHLFTGDEARIEQSVRIANETWPQSPCAGRITVLVARDLGGPNGKYLGDCVVQIRADLPLRRFCSTVVHEAGHAAGFDHHPDPTNVMYALGPPIFAPCKQLELPVHMLAVERETLAERPSHRWTCRGNTNVRRCVGEPTGRARLWGRIVLQRTPDDLVSLLVEYVPRTTKHPQARRRGGARSGPR